MRRERGISRSVTRPAPSAGTVVSSTTTACSGSMASTR